MFNGRILFFATMHNKDKYVRDILEQALGVDLVVAKDFNTDVFGTFTLEKLRRGSQYDALKNKAYAAHKKYQYDLILTSEGSFSPDEKTLFLTYKNIELVGLFDFKHKYEIIGEAVSQDTNYSTKEIKKLEEAEDFLDTIDFPTHGVIVSYRAYGIKKVFHKDCRTKGDVIDTVQRGLKKSARKKVFLYSDMRAMNNPQRGKIIAKATQNLIEKISSKCPQCNAPGFWISEYITGADCLSCGEKTGYYVSAVYRCQYCNLRQKKNFNDKRIEKTDIFGCLSCNP